MLEASACAGIAGSSAVRSPVQAAAASRPTISASFISARRHESLCLNVMTVFLYVRRESGNQQHHGGGALHGTEKNSIMLGAPAAAPGKLVTPSPCSINRNVLWC